MQAVVNLVQITSQFSEAEGSSPRLDLTVRKELDALAGWIDRCPKTLDEWGAAFQQARDGRDQNANASGDQWQTDATAGPARKMHRPTRLKANGLPAGSIFIDVPIGFVQRNPSIDLASHVDDDAPSAHGAEAEVIQALERAAQDLHRAFTQELGVNLSHDELIARRVLGRYWRARLMEKFSIGEIYTAGANPGLSFGDAIVGMSDAGLKRVIEQATSRHNWESWLRGNRCAKWALDSGHEQASAQVSDEKLPFVFCMHDLRELLIREGAAEGLPQSGAAPGAPNPPARVLRSALPYGLTRPGAPPVLVMFMLAQFILRLLVESVVLLRSVRRLTLKANAMKVFARLLPNLPPLPHAVVLDDFAMITMTVLLFGVRASRNSLDMVVLFTAMWAECRYVDRGQSLRDSRLERCRRAVRGLSAAMRLQESVQEPTVSLLARYTQRVGRVPVKPQPAEMVDAEPCDPHQKPSDTDSRNWPDTDSEYGDYTASITTCMVCNIPAECSVGELVQELDRYGFKGKFDFCYMPCDFVSGKSKGYAFVNFESCTAASCFQSTWHGSQRFPSRPCSRTLKVTPAHIQGRAANMAMVSQTMGSIRNPSFRRHPAAGPVPLGARRGAAAGPAAGAREDAAEAAAWHPPRGQQAPAVWPAVRGGCCPQCQAASAAGPRAAQHQRLAAERLATRPGAPRAWAPSGPAAGARRERRRCGPGGRQGTGDLAVAPARHGNGAPNKCDIK
ncbi:unnamed protein product [Prorocentrum cordatum]|uniref:Mei2-like C-terminal RNA recognition motif domain-containing protein n=1 Tax=Prorocentrum cordatum TaxID=2364126 RepID=A0ABN9U4V6_9DINO|nr:unnamed protein product [Polarella glacialis]